MTSSPRPPQDAIQPSAQPSLLHNRDAYDACQGFQAVIMDFFFLGYGEYKREYHVKERPSVHEILYGRGPEVIMTANRHPSAKHKLAFRWVHLPANNVRAGFQTEENESY
jgi:hypothetical protein